MRTATRASRPAICAWAGTLFLITAGCVLALSASPAWPHAPGQGATTSGRSSRTAPGALNATLNTQTGAMGEQDRELMEDLAQANIAEIETGRLALKKSQDRKVRQFAQTMIDDHTSALNDLRQLAQRKDVKLPPDTDFQHKAIATALKALPDDRFDDRYMEHVGVIEHRRTVDLLEKTQRSSQDPDLKANAGRTLPVVQHHLSMAREISGRTGAAGS